MLIKSIIGLVFIFIIYNLFHALYFLKRALHTDDTKLARALTWRISLSFLLFAFLIGAYAMGWLVPNHLIQV